MGLPNIPGGFRGAKRGAKRRSKASLSGHYQPRSQEETQRYLWRMNPIYSRRVRRIPTLRPVRVYKGAIICMFLPGRSNYPSNRWLQKCGETERPKTQYQEQAEETPTTMTDMIAHARSTGVRNPYLDILPRCLLPISACPQDVFVRINPFNVGINPVTFQVDPQEDFIDLKESYFEVKLTVRKGNNTNLLAADVIGIINNLVHTLFKQINMRLNGTLINPQTDTYHLKAFIEAVLNHDRDDGETILAPEGWYNSLRRTGRW